MGEIHIRGKPTGFGKFFRRIPSYFYRLGITKPFEATTLDLSTKGRKSGRTFRSSLGYAKKDNVIYNAALYQDSDWYKNALKYPDVEIQIGKEHMTAKAFRVDDPKEKPEAYKAIIKTQGEKGAEQWYYIKPGMNDKEIGEIGKSLPVMKLEIKG